MPNLSKIRPVVAELIHADTQGDGRKDGTDRHEHAHRCFSASARTRLNKPMRHDVSPPEGLFNPSERHAAFNCSNKNYGSTADFRLFWSPVAISLDVLVCPAG
jgi:hypothetical protein